MNITVEVSDILMPNGFRVQALLPNGLVVGYANISLKDAQADLCDLFVKDEYPYFWPKFMPVLLSIRRKYNFRNLGLGTKLLSKAIEHSRKLGCTKMVGWMHGDKARLARFYRSFGFEVRGINIALDLGHIHDIYEPSACRN